MSNAAQSKLNPFREILTRIDDFPETGWIYLPDDKDWTLESASTVLESEEVPPELEDQPDAGVPQFARQNGLKQVLPVSTVQDIVRNARTQRPQAGLALLFDAFIYYYQHDAFIRL